MNTLLLTVPPYILVVITVLINAFHADRTGERFFHISIPLCFGVVGFVIAASTTSFAPRYFAMMLMPAGTYTAYIVGFAWMSNTIPRPPAKRAAALGIINAVSNMTSIYASFMYQDSAAPRFVAAMAVNAATLIIAILCALILKLCLIKMNKHLEIQSDADGVSYGRIESVAGGGTTETQRRHGFRYLV